MKRKSPPSRSSGKAHDEASAGSASVGWTVPIFKDGVLVYELPSVNEIRSYCQKEVATLWEEVRRFENPHRYYVDLSKKLWDIKRHLLEKRGER
ncbi:MAG: hypothetical protein IKC73_00530 [Clostridia bacterium]|nr:hypothetical protein [Clostridia bacterium]